MHKNLTEADSKRFHIIMNIKNKNFAFNTYLPANGTQAGCLIFKFTLVFPVWYPPAKGTKTGRQVFDISSEASGSFL